MLRRGGNEVSWAVQFPPLALEEMRGLWGFSVGWGGAVRYAGTLRHTG